MLVDLNRGRALEVQEKTLGNLAQAAADQIAAGAHALRGDSPRPACLWTQHPVTGSSLLNVSGNTGVQLALRSELAT